MFIDGKLFNIYDSKIFIIVNYSVSKNIIILNNIAILLGN